MYHSDTNNYAKSPLSWNGKGMVSDHNAGNKPNDGPHLPQQQNPNHLIHPYYNPGPSNAGPNFTQGPPSSLPMRMDFQQYQNQNFGNNGMPLNNYHESHINSSSNSNYNLGYPIDMAGNNSHRNFILSPVQNSRKDSGSAINNNNQNSGNSLPNISGGPNRMYSFSQSNDGKVSSLHSFIPRKTQDSIPSIDSLKADIGPSSQDGKSPDSTTNDNDSVSRGSSAAQSPVGANKSRRSRKGCLTCRQRKKRCCETKPRCQECDRLGLNCRWPAPGTENKNRSKNNKFMSHDEMTHEIFGTIKILRGIVDYKIEG